MSKIKRYIIFILLISWHSILFAQQQRFPKPDFESGYEYPDNQLPYHRNPVWEYIDVAVLIAALSATSYFAVKKHSRRGIIWMSVFSLAYFGFFRVGCICSVGSVQNVSLTLFNEGYTIPLTALLFFIIPLLFALAYGRVFCAGVCPLGAIQELTGIKPVRIPKSIEASLAAVPFIYLAFAVLFAAMNSQFIICRYDPFVGIFRFNAPFTMIIFGVLLLLAGIFLNRPYCRFLCPYGVLLNIFSRFSHKHVNITPASCTNCRLCENSCPYDAIIPSNNLQLTDKKEISRKRFLIYLSLVPLFALAGSLVTYNLSSAIAGVDKNVRLAREIRSEKQTGITAVSQAAKAFKESGETEDQLYVAELKTIERYSKSTPWVGLFLGLSLGIGLVSLTVRSDRKEYKPHKGKCYSCGRCFEYCPVEI